MAKILSVILSGGSGTRLWPASREAWPKQFLDLTGAGKPLLIQSLARLSHLGAGLVITTKALEAPTKSLVFRSGINAEVIGEPVGRNTAPAVLLATIEALKLGADTLVGVFPADHVVTKLEAFKKALDLGFQEAAKGSVVTLGISPSHPATAYGYIELSGEVKDLSVSQVVRFIEKPSVERAENLLETRRVVWNAGIFLFRASTMLDLFKKHMPDVAAVFAELKADLSNLDAVYARVRSESLDYGIMEKIQSEIRCIPVEMGWSDVGSWEEVAKLTAKPLPKTEIECGGNFYTTLEVPPKTVAFVGASDLMVVETPDAILVARKGDGQRLREVVDTLKKSNPQVLKLHKFEERPWGKFEVLRDEEHYKSKKITVLPGQRLSYQSHTKRAEHWIVIRGTAEVVLNDVTHTLKAGEHIFIPLQAKHRIKNPGTEPMEFIEVQTGTYFGEDDITRYSDDYKRS